jgi:8-oxo-dGTP pyrophosphatase MutT (NUDIX family)
LPEQSFGAVVYRKKHGRVFFLLLKHTSGNHWSLAKGHAEPGESEVQTALREIKEETGLKVKLKPGFRAEIRYNPHAGVDKVVVFFLAKTDRKKLKLQDDEISNACWLELDDALKLISHYDTGEVLRQASVHLAK